MNNIIGQIDKGVSTRYSISNFCKHMPFVSQIEPKTICDALKDENWVVAIHDELNQFTRNDVWFLVPNHVYKLKKTLYGLKQALGQWYERLNNFLLSHSNERGKIDKTLFIKKSKSAIILVQIYVDDIIF